MRNFFPRSIIRYAFLGGLLSGWLGASHASAQYIAQTRATPYYLDLSQQTILMAARTANVEQVVDGRSERMHIGLIYKGAYDKRAPVLFQKGLAEELTAWLHKQLPNQATQHTVVLCVRRLEINEIVQGYSKGAQATADLVADVYEHHSNGYHFVRNVAAHTSSRGINANFRHATNVAAVFQEALLQLNDVEWSQTALRPARTLAQLATDKPPVPARPAILRAAAPRKGAYLTLQQFLTNRPDTTVSVRIDTVGAYALDFNSPPGNTVTEWKSTAQLKVKVRTATGEKVATKEIWGFSDGRQAYVRQISTYRPLIRQGDFFTFVGAAPVDVTAMNQQSRKTAENIFVKGLAGAALSPSAPDGSTGRPIVYALDLRTGQAAPYPAPGLPQRADTAFVYVYRPLGGHASAERILLNDREVGQLKPGQYLELAWSHAERPMRLSVGTAGGPAILASPSTTTANYVKLVDNLAISPWQWMPVRRGEVEVDALEKQRKP